MGSMSYTDRLCWCDTVQVWKNTLQREFLNPPNWTQIRSLPQMAN